MNETAGLGLPAQIAGLQAGEGSQSGGLGHVQRKGFYNDARIAIFQASGRLANVLAWIDHR